MSLRVENAYRKQVWIGSVPHRENGMARTADQEIAAQGQRSNGGMNDWQVT